MVLCAMEKNKAWGGLGSTMEEGGCYFMLKEGGKRRKMVSSPSFKDTL